MSSEADTKVKDHVGVMEPRAAAHNPWSVRHG